jgi:hypothetical protein
MDLDLIMLVYQLIYEHTLRDGFLYTSWNHRAPSSAAADRLYPHIYHDISPPSSSSSIYMSILFQKSSSITLYLFAEHQTLHMVDAALKVKLSDLYVMKRFSDCTSPR